ncbi:hypothetical protein HDU98_004217 [Podochytrium sp. JEL0797]|nr:hypothetical protein HDU98_004217 [Podochytrium sp. JEL0797]
MFSGIENAFKQAPKGEIALGAVAVAGVGALGYHEWLKHENKEHSEDAQAQFNSMAQQQQQDPAYQQQQDQSYQQQDSSYQQQDPNSQQQDFSGDLSGGDQQNY